MRLRKAPAVVLLVIAAGAAAATGCGGEHGGAPPDGAAQATPQSPGEPASEWRIGVGGGDGTVDAGTSRAELHRTFAGDAIDTLIHVGEGQFESGTVAYPGDPALRVELIWQDSSGSAPWRIQVTGDSSRWRVGPDITLGTTLVELAELNGRPFQLTGFGWDYGGTVMGWDQGALEQALLGGNGRVILRLAPDSAARASAGTREVTGDAVFRSDAPAMERLNPAVYQIIVEYDRSPSAGP